LWYSTMMAGGMPQTHSRSHRSEIFSTRIARSR
jgi:hypothetical protein